MSVNSDTGQTDLTALGQELLKQNMQQGYTPNSGMGGVLAQMFGTYLNASMVDPNNKFALGSGVDLPTLGTMYGD